MALESQCTSRNRDVPFGRHLRLSLSTQLVLYHVCSKLFQDIRFGGSHHDDVYYTRMSPLMIRPPFTVATGW